MNPVIDIHAHIFRGRDIPLKGYLYSRGYKGIAGALVRGLRLPSLLARCIRKTQRRRRNGRFCQFMIKTASKIGGEDYKTWARILSLPDLENVADCLMETFKQDKIDLFVPLMIDYEYWFKNSVDEPLARQIDAMYRYVVRTFSGTIHPFVPFDPIRELAYRKQFASPDGSTEKDGSLELVKDAIANKGFIGVKIYNSLGYKPWNNSDVDVQRRKLFKKNSMEQYLPITGPEIDNVLDELYTYCMEEEIPITAHCVADGIESYSGASYDCAAPSLWLPVLNKYPDLHLNLAHFGWSDSERYGRSGRNGSPPWVKQICQMVSMSDYPNVYTDVAHHNVVSAKQEKHFLDDYRVILQNHSGDIQKKLLFGIDWHVITRLAEYPSFKRAYVSLLQENNLFTSNEIDDFLGNNALRFLGLSRGEPAGESVWSRNRERLEKFYERNEMAEPRWFYDGL